MEVTIPQVAELVGDVFEAGKVPNLMASPGVGKSDIIRTVAKKYQLKIIDFRLAQSDPTDLNGFPTLNEDRTRCHYAAPMNIPLEGDKIPTGYCGWLLFFDEMTSAPPAVQAASYKIVLDRLVGDTPIHKNVAIACAGNLITDRAIVNRLSTAMQSRLIHFNIVVDSAAWLKWAVEKDIDYRVIAFIRFRPELLHKFDPKHNDVTFPCPRTWEFVSDLISKYDVLQDSKLPIIAGTIGEGTAFEFKAFSDIFESLPTKEQMVNNPQTTEVPEEPSTLYAITALIGKVVEEKTLSKFIEYVSRMPIEFQVITVQAMLKKDSAFLENEAIKSWIKINANELYG